MIRFDAPAARPSQMTAPPTFAAHSRRDLSRPDSWRNTHDERVDGNPIKAKVEAMEAQIQDFDKKNTALGQLLVGPEVTLDSIEYKADRQLTEWAASGPGRQKLTTFLDALAQAVEPVSELGILASAENRSAVLPLMAEAASAWVLSPRWLLGNYGQQCWNVTIAQGSNPYCYSARRDLLTRNLKLDERLLQFQTYETLLKGMTGSADLKDPAVQADLAKALRQSVTLPLEAKQIRDALSPLFRFF